MDQLATLEVENRTTRRDHRMTSSLCPKAEILVSDRRVRDMARSRRKRASGSLICHLSPDFPGGEGRKIL